MAIVDRPPHPATLPRRSVVQPKSAGRPPHPATLPRGVVQPKSAFAARPAHPATLARGSAAVAQRAATYTYANLVVKPDGRGKTGFLPVAPIPKSCIEGAEYTIQCISKGLLLPWREDKTRDPHVFAEFGGGKTLNVSKTVNIQNKFGGLKSYPFAGLPVVGQGLCIANTGSDADPDDYNMHFGAVVARAADGSWAVLTNVSEEGAVELVDKWDLIRITSAAEFMSLNGYTDGKYVLGWLHT